MATIGIIGALHSIACKEPGYFDGVLHGIFQAADGYDHDVVVFRPNAWSTDEPTFFNPRCDGLIVFQTAFHTPIFDAVKDVGVPVVTVGGAAEQPHWPSVDIDNYGGTKSAVEHLLAMGRRRIAMLHCNAVGGWAVERYRAYVDVVQAAGIPLQDRHIVAVEIPSVEYGYEAACALLSDRNGPQPDGIVTVNDDVACGVLMRLAELKISVPKQVAVVGFDDTSRSEQVGLTTIRQPTEAIGARAVELLGHSISYPDVPAEHVAILGEFVVRRSTSVRS